MFAHCSRGVSEFGRSLIGGARFALGAPFGPGGGRGRLHATARTPSTVYYYTAGVPLAFGIDGRVVLAAGPALALWLLPSPIGVCICCRRMCGMCTLGVYVNIYTNHLVYR